LPRDARMHDHSSRNTTPPPRSEGAGFLRSAQFRAFSQSPECSLEGEDFLFGHLRVAGDADELAGRALRFEKGGSARVTGEGGARGQCHGVVDARVDAMFAQVDEPRVAAVRGRAQGEGGKDRRGLRRSDEWFGAGASRGRYETIADHAASREPRG